jgi:hypothetical protein
MCLKWGRDTIVIRPYHAQCRNVSSQDAVMTIAFSAAIVRPLENFSQSCQASAREKLMRLTAFENYLLFLQGGSQTAPAKLCRDVGAHRDAPDEKTRILKRCLNRLTEDCRLTTGDFTFIQPRG